MLLTELIVIVVPDNEAVAIVLSLEDTEIELIPPLTVTVSFNLLVFKVTLSLETANDCPAFSIVHVTSLSVVEPSDHSVFVVSTREKVIILSPAFVAVSLPDLDIKSVLYVLQLTVCSLPV